MKLSTKQTLIKALAAAFVLTAAGGTVLAINSMTANKAESPFNGVYNGTLTAFAEETTPSEGTDPATQVNNLVLKKMISVNNDYMLLATSIDNVTEYKGLGYYITENGVTQNKPLDDIYYTGIQVNTNTEEGTHTYSMADIYGAEYSYKNAGMIVCEIPYTESAEYAVKPYLVKIDDTVVYGANGYKEGTNPNVLKNGSFEKGDTTGWTLSEVKLGNVSDAKNYWLNDSERAEGYAFGMDGNYMFSAYAPGSEEGATGTLTSSTFTLGGSGWITFKLGAAKNGNMVCLEVLEKGAETDTVIARYYNSEWKDRTDGAKSGCTLTAYKANLGEENIGKQLYIRVSDYATSDYGLFFLDSVQTYHKDEPTEGVVAQNIVGYVLDNGGFEKGNLDGWTVDGQIGNVDTAKTYWSEGIAFDMDGNYMFSAYAPGSEEGAMGTLTSSTFTLGGSGWITFKLGGAKNHDQVYMEVLEEGTNKVIARYYNSEWTDRDLSGCKLTAYKANLGTENIGKKLYIRVTDNAASDYGLFFLDSVHTYYQTEPTVGVTALNILYNVVNGGFDHDSNGWTVVTTEGPENEVFGAIGNADATWGENRSYNNDGKFFQNMNEACKGYLMSSSFIVSENGWMTFKLGGNKALSYVSIIDANTGDELARFVNVNYVGAWPNNGWEMYSYKVNLVESGIAAGTEVRIKVVDGATNDYGVVVVDSFVTYYENEPEGDFQKIDKV